MTTAPPKSVLAVAVERPGLESLEPMLARAVLAVYRTPNAAEAFEPLDTRSFDLVLIGHPLPDARLDDFLSFLRRPGAGNAATPVVVVTTGRRDPAPSEVAFDGVRLISFARSTAEALTELSGPLGVAPRQHHRALVKLEVEVDDEHTERRALQTENISETGMLIRSLNPYPVTTRLTVRFDLPSDGSRFETEALVVRHAAADREGVTGMGLRFVGLSDASRDRLRQLLATGSPSRRRRPG